MQKFLGSISTKTGIAFQCKIAVAVADIVQGQTKTSSPGSTSIAPIAHIRPEVQELTEIACLTPKYLQIFFSNFLTSVPP